MKRIGEIRGDDKDQLYVKDWIYELLEALAEGDPEPDPDADGEAALKGAAIARNSNSQIAKWSIDVTLAEVVVTPTLIDFPFYPAMPWVEKIIYGGPVVGCVWFGAKLGKDGEYDPDGEWDCGTFEWLKIGTNSKTLGVPEEHKDTAHALGSHIEEGPLASYVPQRGDECALLVSDVARGGYKDSRSRSNVVLFRWPY